MLMDVFGTPRRREALADEATLYRANTATFSRHHGSLRVYRDKAQSWRRRSASGAHFGQPYYQPTGNKMAAGMRGNDCRQRVIGLGALTCDVSGATQGRQLGCHFDFSHNKMADELESGAAYWAQRAIDFDVDWQVACRFIAGYRQLRRQKVPYITAYISSHRHANLRPKMAPPVYLTPLPLFTSSLMMAPIIDRACRWALMMNYSAHYARLPTRMTYFRSGRWRKMRREDAREQVEILIAGDVITTP